MKKLIMLLIVSTMLINCTSKPEDILITEDAKPIILKAAIQKRVAQDNEFAIKLLKNTIQKSTESNVFISPLSVSIALGMAWNGAAGETKTQIETTLEMSGLSTNEINEYYKIMLTSLPAVDPNTKLSIANSIWYRKGFDVKSSFLKVNADNFNSYIKELDFTKTWAKDTINNWCAKNTNNLIKTIIDGNISDETMMYLVNAVYFKGIWRLKFDKKTTYEADFYTETGSTVKVNMMNQKDTFDYAADELAQYVDMPYGNKAFSMTVILPNEGKTTKDVLNQLTVNKWNETLDKLASHQVQLYLPRFKVENKFNLNDALETMGMPIAFSDFADFTGISDVRLMISEVLHKTYITVDEEGTEAAAVTSIGFTTTSIPIIPIININKPFVFAIREKSTGVILFIGKMGSIEKY